MHRGVVPVADLATFHNVLIKEIQRQPFQNIGKPEPLRHGLAGYWSRRRINDEHRRVYKGTEDTLFIAQLSYHY